MSSPAIQHDPPPNPLQKERAIWLALAVAAPPAAWTMQLLTLTALSNYTCFPADRPLPEPVLGWVWPFALAIDSIAVFVAVFSTAVAWRYFRLDRQPADALGRLRLGRLHFVALGGLLSGTGFLAAIVFEFIATLMVSPCGG